MLPTDLIGQLHQLYRQLANNNDKKLSVILVTLQQQPNGSGCGLFVIANGFEILSGGNPGVCNYDCVKMRGHLLSMFEKEAMAPFLKDPSQRNRQEVAGL